jgi:hypothetical protein
MPKEELTNGKYSRFSLFGFRTLLILGFKFSIFSSPLIYALAIIIKDLQNTSNSEMVPFYIRKILMKFL